MKLLALSVVIKFSFQVHAANRINKSLLGISKAYEKYNVYAQQHLMFFYFIPIRNTVLLVFERTLAVPKKSSLFLQPRIGIGRSSRLIRYSQP